MLVIDDGSPAPFGCEMSKIVWNYRLNRCTTPWWHQRPDIDWHYHRHVPNRGTAYARNKGLELARSEFVAFLDADDRWASDKLRDQRHVLQHDRPDAAMVFSRAEIEAVQMSRAMPVKYLMPAWFQTLRDAKMRFLRFNVALCGSNIMVRRQQALEAGGFDESLSPADDWDFSINMASRYPVAYCSCLHVRYLRWEGCLTAQRTAELAAQSDRVRQKWLARCSESERSQYDKMRVWCEMVCEYLFRSHPSELVYDPYGYSAPEEERRAARASRDPEYDRYLKQRGEALLYYWRLFREN